ncbi:hypothetical protein C0J52_09417, partial [Blattella germanica]
INGNIQISSEILVFQIIYLLYLVHFFTLLSPFLLYQLVSRFCRELSIPFYLRTSSWPFPISSCMLSSQVFLGLPLGLFLSKPPSRASHARFAIL